MASKFIISLTSSAKKMCRFVVIYGSKGMKAVTS